MNMNHRDTWIRNEGFVEYGKTETKAQEDLQVGRSEVKVLYLHQPKKKEERPPTNNTTKMRNKTLKTPV